VRLDARVDEPGGGVAAGGTDARLDQRIQRAESAVVQPAGHDVALGTALSRRRRASPLAGYAQLLAHLFDTEAHAFERAGRDALAFANEACQQVLGAQI